MYSVGTIPRITKEAVEIQKFYIEYLSILQKLEQTYYRLTTHHVFGSDLEIAVRAKLLIINLKEKFARFL
jgi:hypothetical protein